MRGVHKFLGKGTFSALSLLADHHKGHPAYKQILDTLVIILANG